MKTQRQLLLVVCCIVVIQSLEVQTIFSLQRVLPDSGRIELEQLRTAYSKTYLNDDGTLTAVVSAGPVHYEDATGRFLEINRKWLRCDTGGYEVTEGFYEASVSGMPDGSLQTVFRTHAGDGIRLKLRSAVYTDASLKSFREISTVRIVQPVSYGDRLVYSNVFPGTDVHYLYTDAKLKEEIHLSEAAQRALPDPRSVGISGEIWFGFLTEIEFDSTLDVFAEGRLIGSGRHRTKGRAIGVSGADRFSFDGESHVELRRASGSVGFFLPSDIAYYDEVGATISAADRGFVHNKSERHIRRRFFTADDGRHYVLSAVPLSWIREHTSSTLIFDPQVAVPLPTDDTFINDLQATGILSQSVEQVYSGIENASSSAEASPMAPPLPTPYGNSHYLVIGDVVRNRSLVRFTISGVPAGSRILSAQMSVYGYTGTGADVPIALHEMLRSWSEATAMWDYYSGTSSWLKPGVAMGSEARLQPEQVLMWRQGNIGRWMTYDVAELVRRWTGGSANYGVLLKAQEETSSVRYFYSSEHTDAALRPKLEITYAATEPLAGFTYMADGSPSRVTLGNGAATATLSYTARGWVASKQYKAGAQSLFSLAQEYQPDGNVLRQTSANAPHGMAETTASFVYDDLDRLTGATATGAAAYSHSYAYDANGNFTSRSQNGVTTSYIYAEAARPNRLTRLTGRTGAFTYDASGAVTFDGLRHLYYDYRGRVDSLRRGSAPTEAYLYDGDGRRVRVGTNAPLFSDYFQDGNTLGWTAYAGTWSAQSQSLTAGANSHIANTTARYDDFDATFRLMVTSASDPTFWAAFQFRTTNAYDDYLQSGYMVYYRKNGELGLFKAGYGVLASATTGLPADVWRGLRVSAQGSRIRVWVNGVLYIDRQDDAFSGGYGSFRTYESAAVFDDLVLSAGAMYYVRGAGGEVLAEYDASGTLAAEYYYAAGERVAQLRPKQELQYNLTDHLGSTRRLYPSASNWAADYLPYGQLEAQTGTEGESRFGFTGHETDYSSELVYAGARYYDPETGRWLQVDPLADKFVGWSPHNYALNSPVQMVDPTGMFPTCEAVGGNNAGVNCDEYYREGAVVENDKGKWTYLGNNQWLDADGNTVNVVDIVARYSLEYQGKGTMASLAVLAPAVPWVLGEPTPFGEIGLSLAATGLITYELLTAPRPSITFDRPYASSNNDAGLNRRIGDLIPGRLKRVKNYPSELENDPVAEIFRKSTQGGEVGRKAKIMKKLYEQAERLSDKTKGKP